MNTDKSSDSQPSDQRSSRRRWKCETRSIGTKLQGWKMRHWNYRHHHTGGGKCGTGKFGNGKSMERHVWHNLVAHMNTEKCWPSLSHSYHDGAASVLDSVVTYSPSYFGEHTMLLTYVQHFRRFLFQYSGRFSELLCYIALLNAPVNCMICYMNSNSIALTSHRFIARVFTVLYVPYVLRVSLHWLQTLTLYIEANQVYSHLITIGTKTVTNTVIVLKDTITKYKTKNSTKSYRNVQATNMKAYTTLLISTNNWTDDFLWAATTSWFGFP